MKIEHSPLRDVYIITPEAHADTRGFLYESFRADELRAAGIDDTFVQHNHIYSAKRNTVRGLHFQWGPPMGKLMRVTRGAAYLVAVDLRKKSSTCGQWFGLEASAENKKQLYAPGSFARGFQTLTEDCEVQYLCSSLRSELSESAIRFNDPDIGIEWPLKEEAVLSDKDRKAQTFAEWSLRPESNLFI